MSSLPKRSEAFRKGSTRRRPVHTRASRTEVPRIAARADDRRRRPHQAGTGGASRSGQEHAGRYGGRRHSQACSRARDHIPRAPPYICIQRRLRRPCSTPRAAVAGGGRAAPARVSLACCPFQQLMLVRTLASLLGVSWLKPPCTGRARRPRWPPAHRAEALAEAGPRPSRPNQSPHVVHPDIRPLQRADLPRAKARPNRIMPHASITQAAMHRSRTTAGGTGKLEAPGQCCSLPQLRVEGGGGATGPPPNRHGGVDPAWQRVVPRAECIQPRGPRGPQRVIKAVEAGRTKEFGNQARAGSNRRRHELCRPSIPSPRSNIGTWGRLASASLRPVRCCLQRNAGRGYSGH